MMFWESFFISVEVRSLVCDGEEQEDSEVEDGEEEDATSASRFSLLASFNALHQTPNRCFSLF